MAPGGTRRRKVQGARILAFWVALVVLGMLGLQREWKSTPSLCGEIGQDSMIIPGADGWPKDNCGAHSR